MKKVVIFLFFLAIFSLISFSKPTPAAAAPACSAAGITITASPSPPVDTQAGAINVTFTVSYTGAPVLDLTSQYYIALESGVNADKKSISQTLAVGSNTFIVFIPQNTNATWNIRLKRTDFGIDNIICQDTAYQAAAAPVPPVPVPPVPVPPVPMIPTPIPTAVPGLTKDDNVCEGLETGLGVMPTEPLCLVKWILKYAILMGGGIAFLLSLWGGVTIILAGGNPEKINEGKEIISSALTGLFIIIFSVFLLRLIGFDILKLPRFANP